MTGARPRMWWGGIAALGVVLVTGLALRLPGYADRPLWGDEYDQWMIATAPNTHEVFDRVRWVDRNPPGFAVLTHVMMAFDRSAASLRFPSLVGGIGMIAAAWWAGRAWFGSPWAGFLLAVMTAAGGPLVYYSREAKPNGLGAFLLMLFLFAIARFVRRPGLASAAACSLAAAAAVCCQYAAALIVAGGYSAAAVWLWGERRLSPRVTGLGTASAAAAAAAFGLMARSFMFPQMGNLGTGKDDLFTPFFFEIGSAASWGEFVPRSVLDLLSFLTIGRAAGPDWKRALILLAWLPALFGLAGGGVSRNPRDRAVSVLALTAGGAFLLAAGVGAHPFGGTRHMLPLAPVALLAQTGGLVRIARWSRPAAAAAVAPLIGLMVFGAVVVSQGLCYSEYAGITSRIRAAAGPRAAVIATGYDAKAFAHYCSAETDGLGVRIYLAHASTGAQYQSFPYPNLAWNLRPPDWEAVFEAHHQIWIVETSQDKFTPDAGLTATASPTEQVTALNVTATCWTRR